MDRNEEFEGLTLREHLATIAVWMERQPADVREQFAHDFPRTWRLFQRRPMQAEPDSDRP